MRNFKLIELNARNGKTRIIESNLPEMKAWEKAMALEQAQLHRPTRHYWFAVTDIADWQGFAGEMFENLKSRV